MTRINTKTIGLMLVSLVIGLAWACYNLAVAGVVRNDEMVRPLVWVVFAAPAALFVGWLAARRQELGLAAACCFCLYFFSFFVAQRLESILTTPEQIAASGHSLYFQLMIALHAVGGGGLAIWRAARYGRSSAPARKASPL